MAVESKTAVVAALLGNAALTVMKAVTAALSGSAAMLAETFHSAADTGNQVLLYVGMRLSERPPDERHPFGHGMNTYFWAFVVSVMLFAIGGAFAIWEAVRKYLHPGEHHVHWYAFAVLGGALVFESISFAVAWRSYTVVSEGRSLRTFLADARDPTIPTVLLEDSAALLSIVIAVAGMGAQALTGDAIWDTLASAAIGVTLIAVAGFLALENYSLLLGEPASPDMEARLRRAVAADPAVRDVVSLHTLHLGPETILVAAGVDFDDRLRAPQVAEAVVRIEDRVRAVLGAHTPRRFVLIEPATAAARRAA